MRLIKSIGLVVIGIFLSLPAMALQVQNCSFTAYEKQDITQTKPWVKKGFLSQSFENQISFPVEREGTVLRIRLLPGGKLSGFVNNQKDFQLSGTAQGGKFESAYHRGTIKCEPEVAVPFMLQFKPWAEYYSIDRKINAGHIQNSISLDQLYYEHVCFLGDASAANSAILAAVNAAGKVHDAQTIEYIFNYSICVQSHGEYDDYVCDKSEVRKFSRLMKSCEFYYDGDHR